MVASHIWIHAFAIERSREMHSCVRHRRTTRRFVSRQRQSTAAEDYGGAFHGSPLSCASTKRLRMSYF
jgi:hypothetical protein